MANPRYFEFSSLTGGVDGALDSFNTTSLTDASHARVDTGSIVYTYVFGSGSSATENSPFIVAPDTGTGRWLLSSAISKYDTKQNLLTNSGFGVWSSSTLENIGTQISVSDIASGVCTTAATQNLAEGKLVEFGAGGSTASGVYRVTAVVTDTTFTINDTSITDATAVTCYESTPGCVSADTFGPDGWLKTSTLDIYREHSGTNTKDGSFYSAKMVKGNDASSGLYWPKSISDKEHFYSRFAGKTVALGVWVKTAFASNAILRIYDGVSATYSSYHTGGGDWEWIEISKTCSTSISSFTVGIINYSDSTDIAYTSQPMLVFGSVIGEGNYSQPPGEVVWCDATSRSLTDYTSASVSADVAIDIEAQTEGAVPKGFRAINCILSGSCFTAEKYLSLDAVDLRIYSQVSNINVSNSDWVRDKNNDGLISLVRSATFSSVGIYITGVQVS